MASKIPLVEMETELFSLVLPHNESWIFTLMPILAFILFLEYLRMQ